MKPILIAVAAVLVSAGCVAEEKVECFGGLLLHYRYELNPERENRFAADVEALTVLAFDSTGIFHEAFVVDDPADLGADNRIHLPLPDGWWEILTWGGRLDSYQMGHMVRHDGGSYDEPLEPGVSTLEGARLWIDNHTEDDAGGKVVTSHLSPLFHASLSGVETRTTERPLEERIVPMTRNTNTLRVVVRGLPAGNGPRDGSRTGDEITVTASMMNERCRADNAICDQVRSTLHVQTGPPNGGETEIDVTVMRLFTDDASSRLTVASPEFEFMIPGGEIILPIVPTIMATGRYNTQEDLDRENLYEFVIDWGGGVQGGFSVTVNGWKVVNLIVRSI